MKVAQGKSKLDKVDELLIGYAEESYIDVPQKTYKPIDRLSRGMKIIKKLKEKANEKPDK